MSIILKKKEKDKFLCKREHKTGQKKNLFPPLGCDNLYTKFYLRCSIYWYQTV